jgi:hypothetical protein
LRLKAATARTIKDRASTYLDATIVKGKESHGCFLMDWHIRPQVFDRELGCLLIRGRLRFAAMLHTEDGKEAMERQLEETLEEFSFVGAREIPTGLKKG